MKVFHLEPKETKDKTQSRHKLSFNLFTASRYKARFFMIPYFLFFSYYLY
jgi:hypothetical protein